jgi:transcriptional regulator with XRE-family HTH domain
VTGKDLRRVRHAFGERQADFAKRLGLTGNHLARIERGETALTPTVEILVSMIDKERRRRKTPIR